MFLGFSFLVSDYTLHSQHIVGATPFVDSGVGSVEVGSALVDSGTHFVEVVTQFVDSVTHFVDMEWQNGKVCDWVGLIDVIEYLGR